MGKQKRFVCIYSQNTGKAAEIWVDTLTGVNYMFLREGFSGGLTVLVDAEGKPVISREYIQKN